MKEEDGVKLSQTLYARAEKSGPGIFATRL